MSETAQELSRLREKLIADPDVILEDRELMRALISANESQVGSNIVDLRGIAMERLERRLDRLEDTHRSVIAAAYENLAGTNQVQRAVLTLLDARDFNAFLHSLSHQTLEALRIDRLKVVLESPHLGNGVTDLPQRGFADVVLMRPAGWVETYLSDGRGVAQRDVTLRQLSQASAEVYGDAADWIRSEALMRLDLGEGKLPGLLIMGAEDPHQFRPNQGTDLLAFFAGAFQRVLRRWLE